MSYCPNCKTDNGPHYCPPSFGEPGFFMCGTPEQRFEEMKKSMIEQYVNYMGGMKLEVARNWLVSNNIPLPEKVEK